jgi:Domain of unknown function (DUF4397)
MTGVRLESGVFSMNKREFLAAGGAVPLMLAGCGGSGSGSAPVRLVNASVGYPNLGFMVESTQETTADVAYGAASSFINVQAGAVGITLTVNGAAATSAQTRTISKDQRYSLVAYGFPNELKQVLITESTTAPDANKANVNVLNTSVDIGAVDVYLSTDKAMSVPQLIASSVSGVQQSAFTPVIPGSYFITVVGANSVSKGISDVRFQTPVAITLTNQQILTVILTPGASGTLANAILLTQGTSGTATQATQPFQNLTARLRAVTALPGRQVSVSGQNAALTNPAVTILASSTTPLFSRYFVVNTGAAPTVVVNGANVPVVMDVPNSTTGATQAAALVAGGDYTLMVYLDPASGNPTAKIIEDNNTAPVTAQGVKFRLINLASDNQSLQLSMAINSISVATNIPYGVASPYTEVSGVPQSTTSVATISNGATVIASPLPQVMTVQNIFTDVVVSAPPGGTVLNFFQSTTFTGA